MGIPVDGFRANTIKTFRFEEILTQGAVFSRKERKSHNSTMSEQPRARGKLRLASRCDARSSKTLSAGGPMMRSSGCLARNGFKASRMALIISRRHAAANSSLPCRIWNMNRSGMISGIRFGRRAKKHCEQALALAPDAPECKRALALMYLHNPPMFGGDVDKAIAVFEEAAAQDSDSDALRLLLALAHRKADEAEKARQAARHAVRVNPQNQPAEESLRSLR